MLLLSPDFSVLQVQKAIQDMDGHHLALQVYIQNALRDSREQILFAFQTFDNVNIVGTGLKDIGQGTKLFSLIVHDL